MPTFAQSTQNALPSCNAIFNSLDEYVGHGGAYDRTLPHSFLTVYAFLFLHLHSNIPRPCLLALPVVLPIVSLTSLHPFPDCGTLHHLPAPILTRSLLLSGTMPFTTRRDYNERVGPSIGITGPKPSDKVRKNVFVNQESSYTPEESSNEYKVRCAHTILCMFIFKCQGGWKYQRMGLRKGRTLLGRSKMLCIVEVGYNWREQESELRREEYGGKTCYVTRAASNEGMGW